MTQKKHGQLKKVFEAKLPPLKWWVCRMKNTNAYFMVGCYSKPSGRLSNSTIAVAADSYDVVYGPGSYDDCEQYLYDMTGERD